MEKAPIQVEVEGRQEEARQEDVSLTWRLAVPLLERDFLRMNHLRCREWFVVCKERIGIEIDTNSFRLHLQFFVIYFVFFSSFTFLLKVEWLPEKIIFLAVVPATLGLSCIQAYTNKISSSCRGNGCSGASEYSTQRTGTSKSYAQLRKYLKKFRLASQINR